MVEGISFADGRAGSKDGGLENATLIHCSMENSALLFDLRFLSICI
jgi:hypothetical protein